MANPIKTGTGATIAIGTTLAAPNGTKTEYEADSYTAIGEVSEIPEFGDERESVTFVSLADGRRRKARGVADAGETEIIYAHTTGDAGQSALAAAFAATSQATDEFNFRIQFADQISTNPTTLYFRARVMSAPRYKGLTNDGVVLNGARLAINTPILEVAAS
jgi:hypothetical protein